MITGIIFILFGTFILLFGFPCTKQHIKPTSWSKWSIFIDLIGMVFIGIGTFIIGATT